MNGILVHGGAGNAKGDRQAYRDGLLAAAEAGWAVLARGGESVDAVVAAVRSMEDDPTFNAGHGSVLNARGEVECDAAVMRGRDQDFGAVAGVTGLPNPVLLARRVLDSGHVMFVGAGAERFAEERVVPRCDPAQLITQERFAAWGQWMANGQPSLADQAGLEGCDTVGAVALDKAGHLAAATSTGGISFKPVGRVGDSPLVGSGFWADAEVAASSTGEGESLARVMICRGAAEIVRNQAAPLDTGLVLRELEERVGGHGGVIVLRRDGAWTADWNTEMMGHAWRFVGMSEAAVGGTGPESDAV
ncbi:MAG: isoaspartyl peptidase/L-asparaginase family protein [Candidatus Dormibacteria bacterium]